MPKAEKFPERYTKALSLLEAGELSYKQIAKTCGISEQVFYDLVEGDKIKGEPARIFKEEFDKITKRWDKEIKDSIKKCKKKTYFLIDDYLSKQKKVDKNDKALMSTLVSVANALAKGTPNVEIGSFTYTKGLSPEDIYAEFKRLSGLASDRGSIQASDSGRAGKVPVVAGSGDTASEE